jgi:hypothetical protein
VSRFRIPRAKITRDTILFVVGLGGIVYETVSGGAEKPTLIIAFVGMVGLPLFIRNDEQRQPPPPPPPEPASPPDPGPAPDETP